MCTFMYQFINHVILDKQTIWRLTISSKLSYLHQRLIQNRNAWNDTWNIKEVHYYKGTRHGGRSYSPWRANIAPCYVVVRRGEQMASKLCSLSRYSSPWRARILAVANRDRLLSGTAIFHPKNPIFINLNPKFVRNSTYDHSTTWTSIIHEFYGLYTLLTTNSICSTIYSIFKP